MRVLRRPNHDKPDFQVQEILFLDCWHCFSHEKSLDSYRVKCLNARTIAQELRDEIEIDILDEPEFASLTKEVDEVLLRDVILTKHFSRDVSRLRELLKSCTDTKKPESSGKGNDKDKIELRSRRQPLCYAIADLAAVLEKNYFSLLMSELKNAIASADLQSIPTLVNSLLSDLVSQGWQLHNLWTWYEKFLDSRPFDQNLDFMLNSISRPPTNFKVALRITGGTSVQSIQTFGSLRLSNASDIVPTEDHERIFLRTNSYSVFATGQYDSVDFRSAAIAARDELDPLLDALRFEYEPRVLAIDRHALVERTSDGRVMLVELPNSVPNPVTPIDRDSFNQFALKLSGVITSSQFEAESLNKIKIAFRRFRTGRDSYKYSDKFLYWWMGLEALTNSSNKRIGRTVTKNTSYVMLSGYLPRIVDDFRLTIRSQKLDWTQEYESVVKHGTWRDLDNHGFIQLLRDQKASTIMFQQLSSRSLVVERGKLLHDWLSSPKSLLTQLRAHHSRLQWHLDRLYRIRCCLVHGSPVRFKLALFAANLEYYLKQTLTFTLDSLSSNPHVKNLDGLYVRTVNAWDAMMVELDSEKPDISVIDRVLDFHVFPMGPTKVVAKDNLR